MRLSIRYSTMMIIIFVTLMCMRQINIQTHGQNETDYLVKNATYLSLKENSSPFNQNQTNEQLIGSILKNIIQAKDSPHDLQININYVDATNGCIDLEIIQTIHYGLDNTKQIKERKIIILEEEQ